jgi:hypothetical protein
VSDVNHYDPAWNDPSLPRRDRPLVTTHNTIEQLEQALAEKDKQIGAALNIIYFYKGERK